MEVLETAPGGHNNSSMETSKSQAALSVARAVRAEFCSVREEIANSITHGIGALFSVAALTLLVTLAALRGDVWHVVSFSIYGGSLVLLYSASTLYHSLPNPRAKRVFRVIDHAAIYLLIAGSYTPFTLIALRDTSWGWALFGVVWGLALMGVLLKSFALKRFNKFGMFLYLLMGWLIVIAAKPLLDAVPLGCIGWLAAGGVSYTLGVAFYVWRSLPYHHAIWHLFVLAGSVLQFFAVLFYLLPPA